MANVFARVVKVGGSLLDDAKLGQKLRTWLAAQAPARNVIVVGGGRFVDAVRESDRLHGLGDHAAHWLSIRAMQVTARVVAELMPEATLATQIEDVDLSHVGVSILDVLMLLEGDRGTSDELPASWDVTSDTIAARVARAVGASELALLKSTLPAAGMTSVESLAEQGYVDLEFAKALATLSRQVVLRCVDFRTVNFAEASFGSRA